MFPTKAAMEFDDLAYPRSWEGEHFPVSLEQHHADGAHRTGAKAKGGKAKGGKAKGTKSAGAKAAKSKPAGRKSPNIGSTWE